MLVGFYIFCFGWLSKNMAKISQENVLGWDTSTSTPYD